MKSVNNIGPAEKDIPNKPSVLSGDAIYYKHPESGQPHHGVVAGIGKHGMLVDADGGGEHQVEWGNYIAHKARAERKLTIVDRGEDGSIMEDENGKRVFVRGKLDDYAGQAGDELAKSHGATSNGNADIVAAIASLQASQAAQFQGLCAAIALMAGK